MDPREIFARSFRGANPGDILALARARSVLTKFHMSDMFDKLRIELMLSLAGAPRTRIGRVLNTRTDRQTYWQEIADQPAIVGAPISIPEITQSNQTWIEAGKCGPQNH